MRSPEANDRPLVMGSVFKSGTWLLRRILSGLTGLKPLEPAIRPGNMDPTDPGHLRFAPKHYFSWHFVPTDEISELLVAREARVVFLLRNVYDLVVSMYHHFRDDIDADIGRGAGQSRYFAELDVEEGLRRIILPGTSRRFPWPGLGQHLYQMQCMLRFAEQRPCRIVTFERLQQDRTGEIQRLATFLDIAIDKRGIAALADQTTMNRMRAEAMASGAGSHFRQGRPNAHAELLTAEHVKLIGAAIRKHAPELPALATNAGIGELLYCSPTTGTAESTSCA